MAEKITKKMKYEMLVKLAETAKEKELLDVAESDMLVDFCKHEVELLDKKSGKADGKPTKEQKLMISLAEVVEGAMTALEKPATSSKIARLPEVVAFAESNKESFPNGITTQRMTSCLHKLISDGKVAKSTVGKDTVFSLAD